MASLRDAWAALDGVPGIAEIRRAHADGMFYIVLDTHDVERDFVIAQRLFPLRIEYRLVPIKAVGMIPPNEVTWPASEDP